MEATTAVIARKNGLLPSSTSSTTSSNAQTRAQLSVYDVLNSAKKEAFKGGVAGASAQVINVFSLMWLRTTMNYQYRYGGGLRTALSTLYRDGGVPRFYRGLVPALIQSPLSRFGDTAANAGVLTLLDSSDRTANLPVWVKTAVCSLGAASFRLFLMPIDTWKTIKQVEGGGGFKTLVQKGFFTYNYLNTQLPQYDFAYGKYFRSASIGFTASVISDCISNSIRVLKTTKQTSPLPLTYKQALKSVIEKDGVVGLFGRGLKTRILTNGIQGMVFTVGWRTISDALNTKK